jgi:hypothetical protein
MGFDYASSLRSLVAAIARSPIVIEPAEAPVRDFADWCERQNADLDMVILDWLRAQAPHRAAH